MKIRFKLSLLLIIFAAVPLVLTILIMAFDQLAPFSPIIFLVAIAILSAAAVLLSKWLTTPIDKIYQAYQRFGQGNLEYRLDLETGDELGELAKSFNSTADNLTHSITTLKNDRELISSEKNKLAVILSGISDAVIAVDLNRRVILFNLATQHLTGISEDEAIGQPIDQLIRLYDDSQEITPLVYCPIQNPAPEAPIYKKNLKISSRNMKESYVNLLSSQIKGGTAANLGCILTLHDVSKEMQLEEMKLDFVSMAAHELRTPLTSIRGYLSVLQSELPIQGEHKQFLDRAMIAAMQLADLVENLLNVSRIERGTFAITLTPVDWPSYVSEVVNELKNRASDKNITLEFIEPTAKLPPLKADKMRIREVLINLISNAINYTDHGGHIKVWVEPKEAEYITHIQDTGKGIPQEAIPHLFNKFFRVSGSLDKGSKGTGLGLYISKSIVGMHHGKIWVESTLGKGSTFSFSLPT